MIIRLVIFVSLVLNLIIFMTYTNIIIKINSTVYVLVLKKPEYMLINWELPRRLLSIIFSHEWWMNNMIDECHATEYHSSMIVYGVTQLTRAMKLPVELILRTP